MNKFEEVSEVWKRKYSDLGLPETLLDALIAEANAEWDSTLSYQVEDNYAQLTVNIEDTALLADEYYNIVIARGDVIFRGIQTRAATFLFAQVPTTEIIIQVLRIRYATEPALEETAIGFGYLQLQHTKDEECTVNVIDLEPHITPIDSMFGAGITLPQKQLTQVITAGESLPISKSLSQVIEAAQSLSTAKTLTLNILT